MLNALKQLMDNNKIRPLDYQFARLMSELDDKPFHYTVVSLC